MHDFFTKLAKIINKKKSRGIILCGNIHDLFFDGKSFVSLMEFLETKSKIEPSGKTRGITQVIYKVNQPIKIVGDEEGLKTAWKNLKVKDDFETLLQESQGNPTMAVEFLRQLTVCSRTMSLSRDLLIMIEGVEMLLPMGNFASLNFADRKRIAIFHDWFCDPKFASGHDSVILLAESKSLLHPMISRLPQLTSVEIPAPNREERAFFAETLGHSKSPLVEMTAGLSLQAFRQILCEDEIEHQYVIEKVQEFICTELGDDVVEFKRPSHTLKDVVGFKDLKEFFVRELIPRFQAEGEEALPGAAIAGPIGSGKTFLMEAVASELGMPVLTLKNLRSQWFGQTDVIFERLRRTLEALEKVVIFLDEADTQFGGVGADAHETERRLTGKIQAMMSDPKLRGKVIWLLMTARIHRLSPDIRRPGRVGDLIIPVLDPQGKDLEDFIHWTLNPLEVSIGDDDLISFKSLTKGYSAAAFQSLRSQIKARKCRSVSEVIGIVEDMVMPDISDTREYQRLQALLNCTRRSLLPDNKVETEDWRKQLRVLEAKGIE